jgi:hypothetical protein
MQRIRELREELRTPELMLELYRSVTREALDDPHAACMPCGIRAPATPWPRTRPAMG